MHEIMTSGWRQAIVNMPHTPPKCTATVYFFLSHHQQSPILHSYCRIVFYFMQVHMKFRDFAPFYGFRLMSAILRIPRLFRNRGKSSSRHMHVPACPNIISPSHFHSSTRFFWQYTCCHLVIIRDTHHYCHT